MVSFDPKDVHSRLGKLKITKKKKIPKNNNDYQLGGDYCQHACE